MSPGEASVKPENSSIKNLDFELNRFVEVYLPSATYKYATQVLEMPHKIAIKV